MDAIHEEEYRGYTIKIYQDEDPMNPRTEWDNLGTFACFERGRPWIDKHEFSVEEVKEIVEGKHDDRYIWLPVYVYSHSGESFSTSNNHYPFNDRWDSGMTGVILVEKDKVRKEYGWKYLTRSRMGRIEEYLRGEVEVLNAYSTGNVYGYEVEDQWGNDLDSCGGFYDVEERIIRGERTYGGALAEGRGYIDWKVEEEEKKARETQMKMELIA